MIEVALLLVTIAAAVDREETWDLPSVLQKHRVQEANSLVSSLEKEGRHLRKRRQARGDGSMHFLYICSSNEDDQPPHRACQEFLHSVYSMGLFMDSKKQKAAVIHVIANQDCEACVAKNRQAFKFNARTHCCAFVRSGYS